MSPDGANAYVTAQTMTDGISIFDRNTTTGVLTQKSGTDGCISETGTGGACVDGAALLTPTSAALSPDGTTYYVTAANSDAVSVFDRNPTTGVLTRKPGTAGCISETGTGGTCVDGVALDTPATVTISPDGANAYVASGTSDAVAILERGTGGVLSQKPPTAGCISETGTGGACADGRALDTVRFVTVSPDGRSIYTTSSQSQAVSIFDRDTPPETTIDSGPSGVINDNTPTFTFSSSESGSSFECSVDGTPFGAACSGPGSTHTTIGLAEGTHAVAVRAVDPGANPDPSPASRAFTVDTLAPDTTITKKPKRKTKTKKKKAKVSVSFSSDDGASFECKLDKGAFEPCSSPFTAKAKSKGGKGKKHAIEIQATDAAGNVEEAPASVSFKLVRKGRK